MPKLTKDQILQAAQKQISQAEGYDGGELSQVRQDALNYYFKRAEAAPSMPGRSSVQSSDVADMVEAVTAQIMPAFIMDSIVEFEPISEDDVEQADAETQAVSYVVMSANNGFSEFQQAVKDSLLMRNGFMKVYLDKRVDVKTERYERLTVLEYGDLKRAAIPLAALTSQDNGLAISSEEEADGFYNVTVKIKKTERDIAIKSVDPLNCSWFQSWDSISLEGCPFFCEYALTTRSDLIDMGYSKRLVNQVETGGHGHTSTQTRNQQSSTPNLQGIEPSQDLIDYWECYMRIDQDGDGVAELMKVCIGGQTLLAAEEVDFIPYASGTPFLMPHRFNGLGLFDKLQQTQDAKTSILRQMLDNQNHCNNSRCGLVDGMVDMETYTNSRPGGGVIIQSPDAIVPFPFTDIGPSAQNALNYMDKVRSEQGGASLDLLTAEAQIAGDTAHGVERQMTAKEMLAAMMTRTLADTLVKTTFQMVHRAMRLYIPDEIQFRTGGEFVTVNPADWPERKRVTVKAGLSVAERSQKRSQLETIIARQDWLITNGFDGTMVNPSMIYNATLDWCRAGGVDSPERYFLSPDSEDSQKAAQAKQQQAQAQQAYQERLLKLQQQIEDRKANNDDAKVFEDARQFDENMRFEYWKVQQENALKEAGTMVETALKMLERDGQEESSETATRQ